MSCKHISWKYIKISGKFFGDVFSQSFYVKFSNIQLQIKSHICLNEHKMRNYFEQELRWAGQYTPVEVSSAQGNTTLLELNS